VAERVAGHREALLIVAPEPDDDVLLVLGSFNHVPASRRPIRDSVDWAGRDVPSRERRWTDRRAGQAASRIA